MIHCHRGVYPCLYSLVGWTVAGSNWHRTRVEMHHSGQLEAVTWSGGHFQGTRPVGLAGGVGRPHLSVAVLLFRSFVFWCPLELSHQFLWNWDMIWFGSLAPTLSVFILENSQITKVVEIIMLVHKTLVWWFFESILENSWSYRNIASDMSVLIVLMSPL